MIAKRFDEFTQPNKFSRVDSEHILELYIGLDEKGRKAIELRDKFSYKKVLSSGAIEVNQYKKAEYNTIRFSLTNNDISGLFYKFCDDLIDQTSMLKEKTDGYQTIVNRYYQWKKLFTSGKNTLLTEPEIMGLIGEILFLKNYLSQKVGLSEALSSWSGQELTHKDFSLQERWYEVKTISAGKADVKISSLEQLDAENDGELVVFSLEKMSEAYDGIRLNDLVLNTANLFTIQSEKELFLSKVAIQGYMYNNHYDSYVYEVNAMNRYLVSDGFPVLTRDKVPNEIIKASYSIDLALIKKYLIKE
ncbi:MAG: PD-(D/E)XK motif protein [Lachnospiraceae bacterium]|nr:PD-(D/E)XK motif protein [Lachnospiraceae bacterium]